jgi:hypothetical protein
MSRPILSNCCQAPVKVGGEGITHYYVCTKCNKPCDGIRQRMESSYELEKLMSQRPQFYDHMRR